MRLDVRRRGLTGGNFNLLKHGKMRKLNLSNVLAKACSLLSLLTIVAMYFDYDLGAALFGLSGGAGSVALAVTAVGQIQESDYPSDLLERDVDDIVVKYMPDRFPLTTMQNEMKSSKPAAARKFEWVEVGYFPRSTETTALVDAGAGGAAVSIPVTDINMWGRGDVVYVPTVTHGAPATEFRGIVITVDTANDEIDVIAATADGNVPSIPDGTTIYRQSRAAASKDAQADPQGSQGTTLWNWNQTFILQLEMEKLLKRMKRYMQDETVQHDLAIFDYKNSFENAFLFGPRAKVYDTEKKEDIYLAGGVEMFAGQADTYSTGSGIDNSKWINLTKKMFAGNAGSQTRILFGGQDFIEVVLNTPAIQKQLEAKETKVKLGVEVTEISTNYGKVWLKHHKGFDEMGRKSDAFSLDLAHLCERVLEPMHEEELELDKTGQRRVDATRMIKTSTLQVRYPDTHMAIKATA